VSPLVLLFLCGALLRRRVPHIALHSVRPSVCLSVCLSVRPSRARKYFCYRPASSLRMCGSLLCGALLRRRVPHIALHSVRLSVRPVPGSTFVIGQRHPCGCVVSFLLFTFAAPHTVSAISRTSLFNLWLTPLRFTFYNVTLAGITGRLCLQKFQSAFRSRTATVRCAACYCYFSEIQPGVDPEGVAGSGPPFHS